MSRYQKHPPAGPSWRWLAVIAFVLVVLILIGRAYAGADPATPLGPASVTSGGIVRITEEPGPRRRHHLHRIVCRVFGERCGEAWAVAGCETGHTFDPHALGGEGERGLFQIHPVHFGTFDKRRLFEPRYNAIAAFRISHAGRDWSAWSCQP